MFCLPGLLPNWVQPALPNLSADWGCDCLCELLGTAVELPGMQLLGPAALDLVFILSLAAEEEK